MSASPELSVVVPVFDEEESIRRVLDEWLEALESLGVEFRLHVYDDGSRDGTPSILEDLADRDARLHIHHHENRGHGPTLHRAYAEANAPWVAQIDGDGELPAASFGDLWAAREDYDLLLGRRTGRVSGPLRTAVSRAAILLTQQLFGSSVQDPNSPYRLMRNHWLQQAVHRLPEAPFAPNLLLAGIASRCAARVLEIPVPHRGRHAGRGKLNLPRLLGGGGRTLFQAVRLAINLSGERQP